MLLFIFCFLGTSAEPTEEDRKFEELQNELRVFWTDLLPLLQRLPDSSSLHDIARLDYQVKALMVPSDPMDTEQKVSHFMHILMCVRIFFCQYITVCNCWKSS